MAVTFDAAASTTIATLASATLSHTVSGLLTAITVGVNYVDNALAAPRTATVTYAGVNVPSIGKAIVSSFVNAELFLLVNPTLGANNVIVTFSGTVNAEIGSISFNGVDQNNPNSGAVTASATSTFASIGVPGASGNMVVDTLVSGGVPTVGPVQTQRHNAVATSIVGAGSTALGASNIIMQWTMGSSVLWAQVAANINASPTPVLMGQAVL